MFESKNQRRHLEELDSSLVASLHEKAVMQFKKFEPSMISQYKSAGMTEEQIQKNLKEALEALKEEITRLYIEELDKKVSNNVAISK